MNDKRYLVGCIVFNAYVKNDIDILNRDYSHFPYYFASRVVAIPCDSDKDDIYRAAKHNYNSITYNLYFWYFLIGLCSVTFMEVRDFFVPATKKYFGYFFHHVCGRI